MVEGVISALGDQVEEVKTGRTRSRFSLAQAPLRRMTSTIRILAGRSRRHSGLIDEFELTGRNLISSTLLEDVRTLCAGRGEFDISRLERRALWLLTWPQRLAYIQQRLQERGMQVDEAPNDDQVRETYNFTPGNFGAVYRADVSEKDRSGPAEASEEQKPEHDEPNRQNEKVSQEAADTKTTKYKLQSMKWGLIPFWTKRQPDYGSLMRTINCRDDSLIEDRGMWTTMKRRKRCVVVCQGFYEWLKKGPGGKEKIPHFVKRKDGDLMCFAGLWDCVSYEGEYLTVL